MTPEQILQEIEASEDLKALVPDTFAIAAALSVNRTKPNKKEIGHGSILETVGLTTGNQILDAITATPSYKYVKPLLEQGRLIASSPLVASAVDSLVTAGLLTQDQGTALKALGLDPDPVSELDVRKAIFADDGTLKV
jgi:hypothetical protein